MENLSLTCPIYMLAPLSVMMDRGSDVFISIHAPVKGATTVPDEYYVIAHQFQSTHP